VFDHPTPAALARHLLDELAVTASPTGSAGPAGPLEAIEHLEELLRRHSAGTAARDAAEAAEITRRLQSVLRGWHDVSAALGEPAAHDLDSATDDELFEALDKELGPS
ncbi:beta-ketoacyl synthase, partial [Streptomyces cinereoruber]